MTITLHLDHLCHVLINPLRILFIHFKKEQFGYIIKTMTDKKLAYQCRFQIKDQLTLRTTVTILVLLYGCHNIPLWTRTQSNMVSRWVQGNRKGEILEVDLRLIIVPCRGDLELLDEVG